MIRYNYFCITSAENKFGDRQSESRTPDPNLFYDLEAFTSTKHNFYRHEKCFLTAYDEEALVQAFTRQILAGDPTVTFRCSSKSVSDLVHAELFRNGRIHEIRTKVQAAVSQKNRKLGKKVTGSGYYPADSEFFTTYVAFIEK